MNRKQAECNAEKWLDEYGIPHGIDHHTDGKRDEQQAALTNLFIRIDKAAYKRGKLDERNCWFETINFVKVKVAENEVNRAK